VHTSKAGADYGERKWADAKGSEPKEWI